MRGDRCRDHVAKPHAMVRRRLTVTAVTQQPTTQPVTVPLTFLSLLFPHTGYLISDTVSNFFAPRLTGLGLLLPRRGPLMTKHLHWLRCARD